MNLDEQKYPTGPVNEIRAGAESAKGLREENQDAMTRFLSRYGEVILVADGMGGHQGGATASDMVAKRYRLHLESMPPNMPLAEALQNATARVNDEIYERGHSGDPAVAGMGSTLVLAMLTQSPNGWEVTVANAGDSRAYLVRDGVLRQLTKDHTAVQRMIDAGLLTEANARNHPNASVLTRALGQQPGTTVEVYPPFSLQGGDGLLLCSDGLAGYVADPEIARVVASAADPNSVVRSLIETALKSGSDDNITVQFLRIGEITAPVAMPPSPPPGVPVVAAVRRKTGRNIAIAAAILAAALAWPVGQLIGKWIHPKPPDDNKTDSNKTKTVKPDKKAAQPPAGGNKTTPQTPPVIGQPIPGGQPDSGQPNNPGQPGQGGTRPAGTPPAIEIHTPDTNKKPGWVDELKKKIPGGLEQKFSKAEIAPFMPQTGIKISFRTGFEKELETIESIIKDIKDLKEVKVQHETRVDMVDLLPGVDILIVAAADVYQRGVKPR
jgi:serine/threonine protein phosphatase PrpC